MQECVKYPNASTSAASQLGLNWTTAAVNTYTPNGYGTYNMSGNVAEMVYVHKDKSNGTKGGSWFSGCDYLKIDAEDEYSGIIEASPFIGFRPVFSVSRKR